MTQKGKFSHHFILRYSTLLAALVFSALLVTTVIVSAADSDLDPSFDGDGIVTTDHDEFEQINDIAIQPDGKIVAAGHSGISHDLIQEPLSIMLARYNADGSLDATFGSGGIVTTDIGTYAKAWSVAIQTDGKIVIGGRSGTFLQGNFTLVRYNSNGSLDATFGTGGIVVTSFGGFSQIQDLAIQADGKIVVTGDAPGFGTSASISIFTVARYNTDGSLDATFDGDGVSQAVPAGFALSPAIDPHAIAVQADQKIAVAGTCLFGTSLKFCVSRYNSNGSLDNTFDSDGLVTTDFDSSFGGFANDLSIQPDAKIVVAGQCFPPTGGTIPALARYHPNGSLDTSFDSDGRVTMPNSIQFESNAFALQSNGKMLIAGRGFITFNSAMALARFNADGSIDETFGSGGIVTTSVGTGHSVAFAVAVQTDGRILIGGDGNHGGIEEILSDFALVRYGSAVNHPPNVTITGPASGSIFAVNTPVNFTGTFSDDPGDTHVVEWFFESTTQPGTIVVPVLPTSGSANTTFTFTEPGVYKVSLKVTDNNFLSTTATTVNGLEALVVIFDPDGGWVNGGGWFDSPPGAFVQMPALSGKASFAFVSRYQRGATVPIGNTRFQLNTGDLSFQSTSYEWLVVSGNKAQFTGAGTINGSGSYRFMLTTIDGGQGRGNGQDKVRLRIWSDSTGLIYDNQFNAPDSADPATVLGGGNITIHQ